MQYVINSIINIDNEAENYEKALKEEIQKRKDALNDELSIMEVEVQGQIKTLKEKIMEETIKEAQVKAKRISEEKISKLEKINEKFISNKEYIVNSIFQKIVNS